MLTSPMSAKGSHLSRKLPNGNILSRILRSARYGQKNENLVINLVSPVYNKRLSFVKIINQLPNIIYTKTIQFNNITLTKHTIFAAVQSHLVVSR